MSLPRIEKHVDGCEGTGHLQYIKSKAGQKDKGIYRCYNCGQTFIVEDKG